MKNLYDFDELFKEFKNKIYRLALSISKNEKDAEDILQNTFLKIMQNIQNFKSRSQISTWIYKIAYNEALMLLRKKRRQLNIIDTLDYQPQSIPSGFAINWPEFPDKQLLNSEMKKRLDSAITNMPIKYRMPLLLQRVEGETLKTTAQILGLKINSLKTRLHRANMFVRTQMNEYFEDQKENTQKNDPTCNIVTDFVFDFAEGILSKSKAREFQGHINECSKCKEFLDSYLRAIHITKALKCNDLPVELQSKIKTFLFNK